MVTSRNFVDPEESQFILSLPSVPWRYLCRAVLSVQSFLGGIVIMWVGDD
jgi:hypothetical protein